MNKTKLVVFGVIVAVGVIVGGAAVLLLRDSGWGSTDTKGATNSKSIHARAVNMTVEADESLLQKTVSQEGQEAGQLWELAQPADGQQEFVVNAFYEEGESLRKLTGYTKQSLRDSVVTNINLQLPKQYPEYKELTQQNLTLNGLEANETIFTYKTSDVLVKQRLLLLFKNSDTAVYIRAQAKANEYDQINKKYFEPIFSSAKFE